MTDINLGEEKLRYKNTESSSQEMNVIRDIRIIEVGVLHGVVKQSFYLTFEHAPIWLLVLKTDGGNYLFKWSWIFW